MSARLGIIGGYLGSGKSTLVNRLLAGVLPGRTAVVVNDFGSINIDADLIASASGDTIELSNGCICCQISDDASRTMTALAARGDLDHVLCEVSGVGDPGQLATWRDFPGFSPGPVLVCADATSIRRLLRDEYVGDTVARQLAAAEVVLVTKTDLALPTETEDAAKACQSAAPQARLILQDAVDPGVSAAEALAAPAREAGGDVAGRDAGNRRPGGAKHAEAHTSATLECPDPVDVEALTRALAAQSGSLVRAKGIVRGYAGTWHEVQLAGGRVDARARSKDQLSPGRPALVLIAAGPDSGRLVREAAAALEPVAGRASHRMPAIPRPNAPGGRGGDGRAGLGIRGLR
ncbi:GTP-binding protein [Paeniglutamicibacter sp. ZC-3]|uniref:CobW family GTP-binding protein n=1 Tax=Paeniglutamicibacter sp. ZC-3 TaxID=2986919 RepID=UPI0021F75A4D|nr:GTP-binding protein [Paeniglutamicibacter sp. ZC-3]MCV9993154.1 GTP-binding protein [Paeniglutamicibacter sp. ZC-3]